MKNLKSALEMIEKLEQTLIKMSKNPLKPKGVWPTHEEIWWDRADRITIGQNMLSELKIWKKEMENVTNEK